MFAYVPPHAASTGCAVAGPGWVGLVAVSDSPELTTALETLTADADATVPRLLAAIEAEPNPPSFAVVEIVDAAAATARITLAGDIQVDLGGATTTRFSWPRAGHWVTGECSGVETVHISLAPTEQEPASLPLAGGAALASHVTVDLGSRSVSYGEPVVAGPTPQQLPSDAPVADVAQSPLEPAGRVDRRPQPLDLTQLLGAPTWTLLLPDGNEVEAASRIVVGRRPWRTDPDATTTYYVVAPSPRREISGKHLEFAIVGNELHATDLDSTNGTVVLSEDSAPRLLHHNEFVSLHQGDTLDLGEGFRIVVGERMSTRGRAN